MIHRDEKSDYLEFVELLYDLLEYGKRHYQVLAYVSIGIGIQASSRAVTNVIVGFGSTSFMIFMSFASALPIIFGTLFLFVHIRANAVMFFIMQYGTHGYLNVSNALLRIGKIQDGKSRRQIRKMIWENVYRRAFEIRK